MPWSHDREISADKSMSSDMKSAAFFVSQLLSDDFQHCRTFSADIVGNLLPDWLTAGTVATTCKQRDSPNHSGRN